MAEDCVSLIPGIKELLADKGYDTNAIRAFLKERGTKAVIPGKSNRKKKIPMTKKLTRSAMSSSAASAGSRISGGSQQDTTNSRKISFPLFASSLPWPSGSD
jgi:hypothetical protein